LHPRSNVRVIGLTLTRTSGSICACKPTINRDELDMHRLVWLRDHMHYSDTLAQWLHRQFAYEFAEQSLADWQREFAEGQSSGDWQSLIAIENGRLLGGASLATDDLPERPELGPWLAGVFIAPQARQRGLAEQLIEGVCAAAQADGIARLYLHTHDRSDYYKQRGWQVLETFQAWGKAQRLMAREL
jgi:GNAT superfamily N-acetyltransferase